MLDGSAPCSYYAMAVMSTRTKVLRHTLQKRWDSSCGDRTLCTVTVCALNFGRLLLFPPWVVVVLSVVIVATPGHREV